MTGDNLWMAAVAVLAVALTLGVLWVWRRWLVPDDDARPPVRILGQPSPLLTWLRDGRRPRLRPGASAALRLRGQLLGALALAALSQWLLLRLPEWLEAALAGYAASTFLLLRLAPVGPAHQAPFAAAAPRWDRLRPAARWWSLSLAAVIFTVARAARQQSDLANYLLGVWWLLSLALFGAGVLTLTGWRWTHPAPAIRAWARAHGREALAVLALAGVALALRVFDLTVLPYTMANDEGEAGYAAMEVATGVYTNFFRTSWSAQPIWSFVPQALVVRVLGLTLLAVRLVSAVEGALAVAALYLLSREAFGRATAWLAALLLAGLAWHLHFSRVGYHNIVDSLLAPLVLWLLLRALRRGGLADYALAGLAVGATIYGYVGTRLAAGLAVAVLAHALLIGRLRWRAHWPHLLVLAGMAAVTAAPMAAHFLRQPDELMARTNAVSLLTNDRLAGFAQLAGLSQPRYLLQQLGRSAGAFVAGGAEGLYFYSPRPYFPPLGAAALILGLAVALWGMRQPRYFLLWLWLGAVVVFGSALTINAPSNQRMIMAAPAAALLAAVGVRQWAQAAARVGPLSRRAAWMLGLLAVALTAAQSTAFYFGPYRQGHYSENAREEFARDVGEAAARLGPGYRLVLIAMPSVSVEWGNFRFLCFGIDKQELVDVTRETVLTLPRDKGLFVAATSDHVDALRQVAEWLPGGAWSEVPRHYQPEVMSYYGYVLPPP